MSVITEKGDITTSYLLIQRARSSDSGKYICLPSNANSQTINVHVLNGKYDNEVLTGMCGAICRSLAAEQTNFVELNTGTNYFSR